MMEINLGETETELQSNILKFGYGINYNYVVIPYYKGCNHLEKAKAKGGYNIGMINEIKEYCVKIALPIDYYRKQIEYYNQTTSDILTNEIALILPTFTKNNRQRRGIITSLITGFICLVYEGISSFLHHRRQKALQEEFMLWKIK